MRMVSHFIMQLGVNLVYELNSLLALAITASLNQPVNYNPYAHGHVVAINKYERDKHTCIELRGCGRRGRT
jgi:hypothetical protein